MKDPVTTLGDMLLATYGKSTFKKLQKPLSWSYMTKSLRCPTCGGDGEDYGEYDSSGTYTAKDCRSCFGEMLLPVPYELLDPLYARLKSD